MTKTKPIGEPCPHHGSPLMLRNESDKFLSCHSCGVTDFLPGPRIEEVDDF